jgi:hypothetical protein
VYPVRVKGANCPTAAPTTRKTNTLKKYVHGD